MSRSIRWGAGVVIAGAVVAAAGRDPAGAAVSSGGLSATGGVRPGGHTGQVTVVLECEPEGVFSVEVTVTQGKTVAVGRRRGRCTGAAESYVVTVVSRKGAQLAAGNADICGEASTRESGVIDDTLRWCRAGGVVLQEG